MCIRKLNTKEEHQKLVNEMNFPVTMYKVVSINTETEQLFPMYTDIGDEEAFDNLRYQYRIGENVAIKRPVEVDFDSDNGTYTSGFHMLQNEEDVQEVVDIWNNGENAEEREFRTMEVVVEKPEHFIHSGIDELSTGFFSTVSRLTFVASHMTFKRTVKST